MQVSCEWFSASDRSLTLVFVLFNSVKFYLTRVICFVPYSSFESAYNFVEVFHPTLTNMMTVKKTYTAICKTWRCEYFVGRKIDTVDI